MSVSLCGKADADELFTANGYSIVKCGGCGQVRTETLNGMKRTQYYEEENFSIYIEKEAMFRRIFRQKLYFLKRFKKHGRLLDIGASVGLLVDEAKIAGYDALGIEPSKGAVAAAKKHFGISLINKEFSASTVRRPVDIIIINHVLEHVPNAKKIIRDASRALVATGILVIGVPNFQSILSRLKRNRWQGLIPDQHRWHFTLKTLEQ